MKIKSAYALPLAMAFSVMGCTNRLILSPGGKMDLESGDKIRIVTVDDRKYDDRFRSQNIDTIAGKDSAYRKDDLYRIEVKRFSPARTAVLAGGIGIGILVTPYLLIGIGVATGLIPFDN